MKTAALTSGLAKPIVVKAPKRNDDRVILHFDYDCFYASVFENANPALKGQPLGVKQKSILATCNYAARARGVRKLMLISEAHRICPGLIILNGEDLTPFRDVSKKLWSFLRSHSWSDRVERLGLDEVFLDVTDVVAYNQELLNRNALRDSFFQLSRSDPEKGFSFDGTRFFGCVEPPIDLEDVSPLLDSPLCARMLLASHLAGYLRNKLEYDFGYTSSGGISTNKVLAKLAGSVNKPRNQTTLVNLQDNDIQEFMDGHKLRQIPGIGSRIAQLVQDYVLSTQTTPDSHNLEIGAKVTVREIRQHPSMSADQLERILDRPGAERGSGEKVWNLLHGVDASEVKQASDVPTQISIEDTYIARPLNTPAEVARELHALATSLIRRMRIDLTVEDGTEADSNINGDATDPSDPASQQQHQPQNQQRLRWIAYPKTLRLSTHVRPKPNSTAAEAFKRISRSQSLPSFALNLRDDSAESIAGRLVSEVLIPLFRRLHPERQGWNLAMLNVCVTNMVIVAGPGDGGSAAGGGRDIARMFRTQEDKLREWTVYDTTPVESVEPVLNRDGTGSSAGHVVHPTEKSVYVEDERVVEEKGEGGWEVEATEELAEAAELTTMSLDSDADAWEDGEDGEESYRCHLCGHAIPIFAISAHERFHSIGD